MTKRLFAWLLVLALVLSLVPGVAAESDTLPGASQWHDHTTHEGWTEIKEGDPLPTAAGNYYLSADVELTAEWTVTKDIHLCLNGHSIKQTKAGARVAILSEGKKNTLSVYDCVGTGTVSGGSNNTGAAFNVGRTTTLSWYGGKLTGNTSTGSGTIYLQKATSANPTGGVFNMYGGEVSGNKVKAGGAVYTAGGDAGFTGSQVNLYGGTIKNNEATGSGGAIYATSRGKIHVENVTITGNKAGTAGSAIYAEGADHGILVKNATITGNTGTHTSATGYSAAVYTCGAGTHLTLSGKAVIDGNTTASANIPDVVMQSSYSDVLFVNELSAGSRVNFKTNKVTAAKASEVIAIAEGGSQKGIFQSEWITYMDSTNATKTMTYGADGFYFVEGHYHGDQKFVPWTSGTGLPQSDVDGVGYYLTKDVAMSSFKAANIVNVTGGKTLHLCMNGKTVSHSGTTNGAPFEVKDGNLYVSDCTAIYDEDGLFVSGSKVTGFTKNGNGAAMYIYNAASVVEIQGVEFADNAVAQESAAYGGGAIQVRNNTAVPVKLIGCKFTNNSSTGGAGAISLRDGGKLTAEKCVFTGNTAKQGAAIYTTKGTLVLKDCRIEKNHGNSASAISILDTSHVTIADTVITGNTNTSTVGYGAINSGNSSCVVKLVGKTVIYDNLNKDNNQQNLHAPEFAGVVYDLSGLTAGAKVGVALRAERITAGYLYFSTTGMTAVPSGVVSDNEEYTIGVDDQGRLCYETKTVTPPEPAHSHKLCADAACADHTDMTFQKWEKTDSLPTSGNWYLTADVQLNQAFYDNGLAKTTGALNLCLNGHTVTALEGKRVTMVAKDTTLNLTDCSATPGALTGGSATWGACININAGGTMNLYGGKISGNECTAASGGIGAIYVQGAGATFNMYGGEISDNKSVIGTIYTPDVADGSEKAQINIYGGTICDNTTVSGKNSSGSTVGGYGAAIAANKNTLVTISGGVIENNTGSRYGAIFITGQGTQLTMTGGEIKNNTATNGAAVMMQTRSVFNLQGGTISGNKTTGDGGGIYVSTNTDLNMTGGTITGNQSGDEGGAIYAYRSRANLLGGKITDNISKNSGAVAGTGDEFAVTVGGDVQIIDNTVGNKVVNVYLADGQLLKLSDVKEEAKIGITAGTKARVISQETSADCSASFQADHTKMHVVFKENALWLEKIPETSDHFHCVCVGIKNDACDHTNQMWIQWGDDEEEKGCLPTESGYYYLVSDITMTVQTKTEKDQEIFLCLNGKTVTQTTKEERHLIISGGTVYTITDCAEAVGGLTGGYRTYGGSVNINTGATLNLFAGKLYGNTSPDSEGGAIYMQENTSANPAVFNMYGGEITDNIAKSGGAIRAAGTTNADGDRSQVNIYGGLIARNHATGQGGAIYASNNAVVNLLGGTIDSNAAEADGGALRMYTYAKLNLKGTDLTNNVSGVYGGAIFASYTDIVIEAGNISGNAAVAGGGIMMQTKSNMTLNGGTISGNAAGASGGAGIYVSSNTTFTMNGGTISGNKTEARGGGIYFLRAEATLNGGVIEKNEAGNTGGGLNVSGTTLQIHKITISGNSANEGGGLYINRTSTGSGDTLKYYPSTVTINDGALITGNQAPSNCGGMLIANEGVVVTMLGGEISKNISKNGAGVMTWAGSTFILKGGKITNHKIAGNGGGMYISTGSTFKMEGGTITGNTAKSGGGAYFLRSDVTLSGGAITGNYARKEVKWSDGKKTESGGSAGGFYATGAKVKLCGTSVTYNKAEGNGGGFVTARTNTTKNGVKTYYNPIITITGGTISYNEGYNAGGLLTQTGTTTYFYGGTVSNNKANRGGGGVYISSQTTLYMTGGRIVNNYATTSAGGIYFYKSTGQVTGGEIHDNTAKGDSGNVLVNGAEANVVLKNLKIYGGKAKTAGGMVYQSQNVYRENGLPVAQKGGSLYVENCEFFDNVAEGGSAGGVYIGGRCNPTFVNCKFFDNECTSTGGGVRVEARSFGTFTNCEFTGNRSGKDGGGLWVTTGTELTMTNPVFRDNHAEMKGGAIGCFGNIDMTDAIIENNTAKEGGGAVYSHFNTVGVGGLQPGLIMRNTLIRGNATEGVGGALWVHKSTRVKLYDSEITGNTSALEGGAIWAHEDLELHNTSITGNTSGGEGYAVYMNDAEYDGHSYMASRNRITGNVIIKDNEGGDLWMGPDVVIVIGADGLGEKTHIELVMDSGVLTNRLFGAYHYEGGEQVYTVTYGDRSVTEPEYDASLAVKTQTETSETQQKTGDVLLYVGIGIFVLVIAAVGILLAKKKKAGKAATEANKE